MPPPNSVTTTSRSGIGKSPTEIVQQNSMKTAPVSTADTAIERMSRRADIGPMRSTYGLTTGSVGCDAATTTKKRRADEAVMMPTCTSDGRATTGR